jgi:hypothetical protein
MGGKPARRSQAGADKERRRFCGVEDDDEEEETSNEALRARPRISASAFSAALFSFSLPAPDEPPAM